jgi:hypothetical protein
MSSERDTLVDEVTNHPERRRGIRPRGIKRILYLWVAPKETLFKFIFSPF